MERLRALFSELGFSEVETFIASGNAIFETDESDADALEARIEAHLKSALGYEVATFLRTPAELAKVVRNCPFSPAETDSLYVTFHKAPLTETHRASLDELPKDTDAFAHAPGASCTGSFAARSPNRRSSTGALQPRNQGSDRHGKKYQHRSENGGEIQLTLTPGPSLADSFVPQGERRELFPLFRPRNEELTGEGAGG